MLVSIGSANSFTGTQYLNNSGHRWVNFTNGERDTITLTTDKGNHITRKVIFWEAWGRHAIACISYKGKKIKVFADSVLVEGVKAPTKPKDGRYTIGLEYDGHLTSRYVVRFCGDYVQSFDDKIVAIDYANRLSDDRRGL